MEDTLCKGKLTFGAFDAGKHPGMSCTQLAGTNKLLNFIRKRQKTQEIGYCGTRTTDTLCSHFLCITAGIHQSADAGSLFERVQILTLQVFNQGGFHPLLLVKLPHNAGNGRQAGHAGRTVTALAGHDTVTGAFPHQQQGLQYTGLADTVAQCLQGFGIKMITGLVGVGIDLVNGNLQRFVIVF